MGITNNLKEPKLMVDIPCWRFNNIDYYQDSGYTVNLAAQFSRAKIIGIGKISKNRRFVRSPHEPVGKDEELVFEIECTALRTAAVISIITDINVTTVRNINSDSVVGCFATRNQIKLDKLTISDRNLIKEAIKAYLDYLAGQ